MVTVEELKREREKHADELKAMGVLDEKCKIKRDIKRIKGAKLRTRLGLSSAKIDNLFRGTGKILKKSAGVIGKGILGAGEAANRMYDQPQSGRPIPAVKKLKKRSKRKKTVKYTYFN